VSVPAPHERINQPGALLSRSDLRDLGLERRYARPLVRAEDYMALVESSTFRGDRVRPT
jgi:hypothetical protein